MIFQMCCVTVFGYDRSRFISSSQTSCHPWLAGNWLKPGICADVSCVRRGTLLRFPRFPVSSRGSSLVISVKNSFGVLLSELSSSVSRIHRIRTSIENSIPASVS